MVLGLECEHPERARREGRGTVGMAAGPAAANLGDPACELFPLVAPVPSRQPLQRAGDRVEPVDAGAALAGAQTRSSSQSTRAASSSGSGRLASTSSRTCGTSEARHRRLGARKARGSGQAGAPTSGRGFATCRRRSRSSHPAGRRGLAPVATATSLGEGVRCAAEHARERVERFSCRWRWCRRLQVRKGAPTGS